MEVADAVQGKRDSIYIIGNLSRHNILTFITRLEWEQYPPGTDKNDAIHVFVMYFQGLLHNVIEIPANDYQIADRLARELTLKLVPGRPVAVSQGGQQDEKFRITVSDDRCFTLEGTSHVAIDKDINSGEYAKSLNEERQRVTSMVHTFLQTIHKE